MTDIVMSYAHLVRSNPLNFINSDISCLAWRASTSVALPESKSSTLIHVLGYFLHCFRIYVLVILSCKRWLYTEMEKMYHQTLLSSYDS